MKLSDYAQRISDYAKRKGVSSKTAWRAKYKTEINVRALTREDARVADER